MIEYDKMNIWELKRECKKQKLDFAGGKKIIIDRLNKNKTKDSAEQSPEEKPKTETPKVKIVPATEDELAKYLPNTTFKPVVDNTKFEPWLTDERLQALNNKLAPLAAANGHFKFVKNYEQGEFYVSFFGGASGPESTTLIDVDAQIVRLATRYYKARMATGANGLTSQIA